MPLRSSRSLQRVLFLRPAVDGSRRLERPRETVIIKSCNQLANLSSSVLIKPGPVISVLFPLPGPTPLRVPPPLRVLSTLPCPFTLIPDTRPVRRLLSFIPRPTHAKLFLPFRTSSPRRSPLILLSARRDPAAAIFEHSIRTCGMDGYCIPDPSTGPFSRNWWNSS